jgi:tetratricopeptide (TPR) repeat protein
MNKKIIIVLIVFFGIINSGIAQGEPAGEPTKENYYTQGKQAYSENNYETARDNFVQALLMDPRDRKIKKYINKTLDRIFKIENHIERAGLAENDKNYKAAYKNYRKILKLAPDREEIVKKLYLVKRKLKSSKKVRKYLKQSTKHVNNGELLFANDKLYTALEVDPGNEIVKKEINELQIILEDTLKREKYILPKDRYNIEGFILYNRGKLNNAVIFWEKSLSIETGSEKDIKLNRLIEKYVKKTKKIIHERETKEKIENLIATGLKQYNRKWYKKAKESFSKVLELDPNNKQARKYVKKCKSKLKKPKIKKAYIPPEEKAIPKDIKKIEEHYQQGLIYYAGGHLESAIKEFEHTLRLDPDNQRAKQALEKAKKELELSIE